MELNDIKDPRLLKNSLLDPLFYHFFDKWTTKPTIKGSIFHVKIKEDVFR